MDAPTTHRLQLRSGDHVWVRPIEAADADELRRAFAALSEQSRYRRFFTGMRTVSDARLRTRPADRCGS